MTISAELQEMYTSEVDVEWANAFIISHPKATTRYLINYPEQYQGSVNGHLVTFEPVYSEFTPPKRDSTGRIEASITWCGIFGEALEFMNQVMADATIPVTCNHSVFIIGDPSPQIDPWMTYYLTNVAVTDTLVTATATMGNTINRKFPGESYRLARFPGMRRR